VTAAERELVRYRLERAAETLEDGEDVLPLDLFEGAMDRRSRDPEAPARDPGRLTPDGADSQSAAEGCRLG